jgi:hypothetical protein
VGTVKRRKRLTLSTLSSERSDDSYRKRKTTTAPRRLHAAKTNPYLNPIAEVMNGVKNARRKFHVLFDVVSTNIERGE